MKTENRHYAHVDVQATPIMLKHDYWCCSNGWCYFSVSVLMSNATNKRTHSLAKQVGVPNIVVFLNKEDQVDDKELRTCRSS
jgi:elongation factor Tu